jgi:hypothetical protein
MKYVGWILGALGAALIAYLAFGKPITVTVPEAKVQEEVQARLPMEIVKSGVTINIDTLKIDFLEEDQVQFVIGMDLAGYGITGRAVGDAKSSLRYEDGELFLEDISLDDLNITSTGESTQKLDDMAATASALWNRLKKGDGEDADTAEAMERIKERAIAKLMPKAVEMANAKLQEIPVYSLNDKDMKMDMAAMALEDITFASDRAEVTLDPRNVILWVLGMALIFGAAGLIALGMIRSGMFFTFLG